MTAPPFRALALCVGLAPVVVAQRMDGTGDTPSRRSALQASVAPIGQVANDAADNGARRSDCNCGAKAIGIFGGLG
jgi:hypothetical protein